MIAFVLGIIFLHGAEAKVVKRPGWEHLGLFGTEIQWTGAPMVSGWVKQQLENVKSQQAAFDPDCYYSGSSPGSKVCDRAYDIQTLKSLESAAAEAKTDTGGAFEVFTERKGKPQRDFGGIAQGFVLEQLARRAPGPFFADFSGDMYLGPGYQLEVPLGIENPIIEGSKLADVRIKSGWFITSSSLSRVRLKAPQRKDIEQYIQVSLFAKPEFNGARLDAWATSIIAGGAQMVARLEGNSRFKGQWGYFAVTSDGELRCSKTLTCDLSADRVASVMTPW